MPGIIIEKQRNNGFNVYQIETLSINFKHIKQAMPGIIIEKQRNNGFNVCQIETL